KEPKKVEVVINSGMPGEKTFLAQVIGVDRESDLALLSVSGQPKDWPEPLLLSPSSSLAELQHVFIFGYPLGASLGPEISVNESQISALRRNEVGNLRYVQVAGGMHPGNSGGPVVDTRGAVVGVSVSVLRGTMINFAVPGDKVRQLVNGRIVDTHVYEPYKEGSAVRLPVEIKTLDPMRRIKDVSFEVWAGPPGKARAGGSTPPVKRDGDGPHTIVEARLETEDATADVDMPQIGKDKVIWVQSVLTDQKGHKLWGNAESATPSGLPPLERTAIQLVPKLDRPAERSIHVKESMSFRVMGGINEREIVTAAIDSKVLEKVARTSNGGGQVNWSPGESTRNETFDGKATKDPVSASEYVRRVPFKFLLDGQGRLASTFVFRPDPRLERTAQRGAMAISNALSNSFQMTAIYPPNPDDETRPNVSWYGRSQVFLGLGNRIESAVFISTWNYEGVRMHEGRRRAYCRFKGYFLSPNPRQAALFNNEIEGHVHFDLEDGYVAESHVKIVSEISDGEGKYGTMVLGFELTRAPGNTYAIVPPKDLVVADALSKMKKLKSLKARLEANDPKLPPELMAEIKGLEAAKLGGGWPFKAYKLKLEKGKTYVIDMVRTDIAPLDPFLILQDKSKKVVAQDDDGA
ncbi:MAG TPA: serine protease, partial [Gemmataceae bacterium]|nr:serine protease [Gemmataceae bacterium]